ncbi:MAG: hypothetical protein HYZ43_01240 [Flavobacteriia bacterium]|nr:hypothetical protein [Flavobacteriia bacterium]
MINVLFWNINKKDVTDLVVEFAHAHSIDILVLIEDEIPQKKLLTALNSKGTKYHFCSHNTRNISIYSTFIKRSFDVVTTETSYISLIKFQLLTTELIFGALHLPSKLNSNDTKYRFIVRQIQNEIADIESIAGHNKTLMVAVTVIR